MDRRSVSFSSFFCVGCIVNPRPRIEGKINNSCTFPYPQLTSSSLLLPSFSPSFYPGAYGFITLMNLLFTKLLLTLHLHHVPPPFCLLFPYLPSQSVIPLALHLPTSLLHSLSLDHFETFIIFLRFLFLISIWISGLFLGRLPSTFHSTCRKNVPFINIFCVRIGENGSRLLFVERTSRPTSLSSISSYMKSYSSIFTFPLSPEKLIILTLWLSYYMKPTLHRMHLCVRQCNVQHI